MLLTVFGAFATFEREVMLQRQREGIAAAKAAGKYRGESPRRAKRLPRSKGFMHRVLGLPKLPEPLGSAGRQSTGF